MRSAFLPFALPDIDQNEIDQVVDTLKSNWITTGPKTRLFEEKFAEAVGAKHAVAVNSCTAAMHLALEAAGVQKGDEVITSTYTFAASAEVIRYFDAKPVLVDINPSDFNMDPQQIDAVINSKTKAIIPVHIAGLSADMNSILEIAQKNKLFVIEDAAHAFPSQYQNKNIGQIGDATCFSFYATKTISTGEGGMLTTDHDDWADRCRIMSLHGISKDAWKRYMAEGSWYYEIVAPGFKYNLTDIASSLGLAQLDKAERMRLRREEIAMMYNRGFKGTDQLQLPENHQVCKHAWHLYMLRLNLDQLTVDRAQFTDMLKARNIGMSVHFIPLHMHPYYQITYGYQPDDFPVAFEQYQREISLPIYSCMSDEDVNDVIEAVLDIIQGHIR